MLAFRRFFIKILLILLVFIFRSSLIIRKDLKAIINNKIFEARLSI